jgi:hypothetical protein
MVGLALLARLAFATQLATAPAPAKDGKVIVRLVARHNEISIVSTPQGVRYSAFDKQGKMLISKATLDELKAQHPNVYKLLYPTICVSTENERAPVIGYAGMSAVD